MDNRINAVLIDAADDVATAILELKRGDVARYLRQDEVIEVVTEGIPRFHKFAVRNIKQTELVRKYGEIIGEATQDITRGSHVHSHNLTSPTNNERKEVAK